MSEDRVYERLNALECEQARTDERYTKILEKLTDLETKVSELSARPARRWENVVTASLQWLVVLLLGAGLAMK